MVVGLFASARREKGDQPGLLSDLFPRFRGRLDMEVAPMDLEKCLDLKPDAVFLATPHEASLEIAPRLAMRGVPVLDLSGAFRLKDASLYPRFYNFTHTQTALLDEAAYGLPEIGARESIRKARLISVPGCYPTSAIVPLAALARAGVIAPGTRPIVDSVSGVSGAGRGANVKSLFCEVSLQAYNVLKHRHNPEIDAYAGVGTVFTPHLVALDRGILSTIHVELAPGWSGPKVRSLYEQVYGGERFVRLLSEDRWPAVADVAGTNFVDIGLAADDGHRHLIISSALDNLVKGAAGQAVQCMNIRLGHPEWMGLLPEGGAR
jgi:N-acetyl-gamma-glutamyl-phosphate reductase